MQFNNLSYQFHYQVNDKIFFNLYLAYYESFKSGKKIEFYCKDDDYDQIDWSQEPEQSFDQLMDTHAQNLRNKYEKLILLWSGGTDSHTIYNVFKRNNLHIDEIAITYDDTGYEPHFPVSHVSWIMDNHWDPTTVISSFRRNDGNGKKLSINNDNWLFENKMTFLKFGNSLISDTTEQRLKDRYSGSRWAAIIGVEKPFIHFENGTWYTRQNNKIIDSVMGLDHTECFFLDPIIHLKQSHMAKRALKRFRQNKSIGVAQSFSDGPVSIGYGTAIEYLSWAKVVGRHDELYRGVSYTQKLYNGNFYRVYSHFTDNLDHATLEPYLKGMLQRQAPVALNYINGIHNLKSEKEFSKYIDNNHSQQPGNLLDTKIIWSKGYNLGE
jgi:hypothetical protein